MLKQKIFISLVILLTVFLPFPQKGSALTIDEIIQNQNGKVLGDSTNTYPFPSGSLVNENGTIYFISGITKIPFTSWQTFVGLGYSLRNVVNGNLQNYTPSSTYFITTANADHPWGSWLLYNGTIYYAHETGLVGIPSWDIFLKNGGNLKYLVKANKYDVNVLNSGTSLPLLTAFDDRVYGQPTKTLQTPLVPLSLSTTTPPVACTMEAKLCPDGKTYVSRQAPSCDFVSCPATTTTTTTPTSTIPITQTQKLSTSGIRSVTFNIPGEDLGASDQFYNKLSVALPSIKQTGFNAVWLVNWWQVFEPTALPQPTYNQDAFTRLKKVLDLLRANNMKAILGVNYIGGYRPPQGVDGLHWIQNPDQYKAFETYLAKYLTEIKSYNDMAYVMVFTENSEPDGMADQSHAQQLANLLRPTLGSMPTRLPQDLRNLFTIGYHDYSTINLGWANGQSPITSPNPYDFVSMVAYGQDLSSYADINTEMAVRAQRFKSLYPNTPLMIGEIGGDYCSNNEQNQARVAGTIVSYALKNSMGSNVWGWTNKGSCGSAENDQFSLTNSDGSQRQITSILKRVFSGESQIENWLKLPTPDNNTPVGQFDMVDTKGNAVGWIYDPDEPNLPIHAVFYLDGDGITGGKQIGELNANTLRADVNNALNITGNHGFVWPIPQQYKDGKQHTMYIYGRDSSYNGTRNRLINGTKTFAFNPDGSAVVLVNPKDEAIKKDLQNIKSLGFSRVRVLTFVRYPGDPVLANWPTNVFISFPKPTEQELANLKHYLQLIDQAGLRYEFVFNMADSKQKFYTYNITGTDYKNFIDSVWPNIWIGKLDRVIVGGDLSLNPLSGLDTASPDAFPNGKNIVESQRKWIQEIWPYVYNKCPTCNMGLEFLSQYANLWDQGVSNTQWVKTNLTPQPKFFAYQFYPTTSGWMQSAGYAKGSVYDWGKLAQDWYNGVSAVAGNTAIVADEIGLATENGWTAQDQSDFLKTTTTFLLNKGVPINIWEYADHSDTGLFGLYDANKSAKLSASAISTALPLLNNSIAGIHYNPPDSVGWQFIMP